jgi:asparagine synthase (glutamine-hydrolysing)
MVGIDLIFNTGFSWHSKGNCHVKGFAHVPAEGYLEGISLPAYFEDSKDFGDFVSRVSLANGMFSVVLGRGEDTWMAVDRMRTFPVFYVLRPAAPGLLISDSTDRIIEQLGGWSLRREASTEFLATGYVTGNETLAEGIFQVQAGEAVKIKNTGDNEFNGPAVNRTFYSSYRTSAGVKGESVEEGMAERIAGRLVSSLDGRTAAVALSGGFDSRFVAAMLKKLDYPRVTCFSYGRDGNADMMRAGKVAARLGYKFIPIPYSNSMIQNYPDEKNFNEYFRFSSNRTSMFFMQEYFAVRHLRDKGLVPFDAVFIPGHSGDFFGGSQLIKHGLHDGVENIRKTTRRIFDVKYSLCRPGGGAAKAMLARIEGSLREKRHEGDALAYSMHEDWDLKEKLAKFIVNSCNVYAWYGYEYRLPLYDYELQDFFRDVPFGLKRNKWLYDEFLINRFFGPLGLNFPGELQPDEKTQQRARIRRKIRNVLPESIAPVTISPRDPIYYNEITSLLCQDLARRGIRIKIRGNSYNSLIVQWYIARLESELPGARSSG